MREVPDITTSRDDVVVDSVTYRPGLLGLFGRPRWRVCWRLVAQPTRIQCLLIDRDCRAGSAAIDGLPFSFLVRWRGDRRRRVLQRSEDMVTPRAVMQLADVPGRR